MPVNILHPTGVTVPVMSSISCSFLNFTFFSCNTLLLFVQALWESKVLWANYFLDIDKLLSPKTKIVIALILVLIFVDSM